MMTVPPLQVERGLGGEALPSSVRGGSGLTPGRGNIDKTFKLNKSKKPGLVAQ